MTHLPPAETHSNRRLLPTVSEVQEAQRVLVALRQWVEVRRDRLVADFLHGRLMDPIQQGRATEREQIHKLLSLPAQAFIEELRKDLP